MRILIVDDEAAARQRLASLVELINVDRDLEIVGEADNGLTAIELARERRPDVMLLDIAMREIDGFDVARHLPEPRPLVIFQTAYQEHALQAFEHEALDYVVKPVRKERLAQALDRARVRLAQIRRPGAWNADTLGRLETALGYRRVTPARILVRDGAGHRLVPLRDIVRFSAEEGLVRAHTASGTPATDYSINELEGRTAGTFIRVSRADLVSLARIQRIAGNGDGSATLSMADGTVVRVSRRRAAAVKAAFG